ncbi:nuclear transport factor 2-like protein [Streptomyces albidoflavus]|uniref:hypothetical protein n=1 Tax=Streptomyces albidoflavus TaxID=1886 RepID=UPI001E3ED7F2|nr:hypothetical protein [Streptomyces albidoflavus]
MTDNTTDHTTDTTFRPAGPPLPTWPAAPAPDTPSAVVTALWARMQARDWSGVAALLAPDAVVDWLVSAERLPDRDACVAVNAAYPEGWTVHEPQVIAQGSTGGLRGARRPRGGRHPRRRRLLDRGERPHHLRPRVLDHARQRPLPALASPHVRPL